MANIRKVDLNLLKVFVVVYQEKSIRKASAKLFLSPAAVSQNIKKLKASLGEELFVLCGKDFLPTAYSDTLFQEASPLLEALIMTVEKDTSFDPTTNTDTINLELNPHLTPILTPKMVSYCIKHSPKMSIRSHTVSSNAVNNLLEGKSDLLVHYDIDKLPSELIKIPLKSFTFTATVRQDHPFKKATACIDELLEYPFGSIDLAYLQDARTSFIEDKLQSLGKNIDIKVRATSISALIETVKTTDIVAGFVDGLANQHAPHLRTIQVTELDSISSIEMFAFMHKRNLHAQKYKWLLSLVQDLL